MLIPKRSVTPVTISINLVTYTDQVKNLIVAGRNKTLALGYRLIAKPIFFRYDPESVHDFITHSAAKAAKLPLAATAARVLFDFKSPLLGQQVHGIAFANPVGLSAGFDKNGLLTDIMPAAGFGFMEIGSITGEPCDGNPKPRLWRLKDQQSLIVWYGLMNDGATVIAERLTGKKFKIPVGISLAKTNSSSTIIDTIGIADYAKVASAFKDIGDYFTINISCPNTYGGEPFTEPTRLDALLSTLDRFTESRPTFVKLPPDLTVKQLHAILAVCTKHHIDGFISTNLTKRRNLPELAGIDLPANGGFSGKLVQQASDTQIAEIYRYFNGTKTIIGVGGVFTAEDAYRKIRAGATLIQLITGMIFQGPQCISEINRGLVKLLERDGYTNISQATGADHKVR